MMMKKFDFLIENYDRQKCFSSFLPGIAGKEGTPMWVFYVNRGQGIASFGITNKDNSIMEFKPADQSYTATPLKGFRTFLKIDNEYYEAFSETTHEDNITRNMYIYKNKLEIVEENKDLELKVKVIYFTISNEEFPGLIRRVEIENLSGKDRNIEVVDGLPEVLPYGVSSALFKDMGFTARAWMQISNVDKKVPFYGVRTEIGDIEVVEEIKSGYFYFATNEDNLLDVVYDKNVLFEMNTSLQIPYNFKNGKLKEILSKKQYCENTLPSAFSCIEKELKANDKLILNSMFGFAEDRDDINAKIDSIKTNEFVERKLKEADEVIEEIVDNIYTKTSNELFNKYCEQNYMDNILRGGYPLVFDTKNGKNVYHIFSRKHGDLERDYNFFSLQANKYSQGNGNFRDVLQNRRNDILFNPEIEDFNLNMFINFIQADGNNPLVVKGTIFKLDANSTIFDLVENKVDELKDYLLNNYFTPGEVLSFINNNKINLKVSETEFVNKLMYDCEQFEQAEFGEGYWIDHFTYLMDLVDSYKEIYPEKIEDILFNKNKYRVFDSPAFVKARKDKYKMYKGNIMQIGAVLESHEKEEALKEREHNYLVDKNGNIYTTNMFEKLLLLGVNKFATLDPFGMGLEMEANKPGWNDALNGLPGIIGSGMSETFELKRVLEFLLENLNSTTNNQFEILVELKEFVNGIAKELDKYFKDNNQFDYWDRVAEIKETYREKVFFNVDGAKEVIEKDFLIETIEKMLNKMEIGIKLAKEYGKGIYPTYFTYTLVEYEEKDGVIIPKKFDVRPLPYFLEGVARAFKIIDNEEQKELYKFVKESNVYDKKLKMYKTSESIENESYSIGRLRAFTPGWLENESIFMHMEFKYLLEILKANLLDEFYEDIKTMLPPFLDYKTYGRSVLENSSFIVSSANSNENLHGQGFSARLSGSTAEFLSMWKYIFIGDKLFEYKDNNLTFTFNPKINKDFFDENGEIEFKLFSKINVKYINPSKKSTYGEDGAKITKIELFINGEKIEITGNMIAGDYAYKLREKNIDKVICYFE